MTNPRLEELARRQCSLKKPNGRLLGDSCIPDFEYDALCELLRPQTPEEYQEKRGDDLVVSGGHVRRISTDTIEIKGCIQALSQLEELYIESIGEIPPYVFKLKKLKFLYLTNGGIVEVPEEIKELKLLRELSLSGNQIQVLPAGLFDLANLRLLSLDHNQLTGISSSLSKLQQMEYLNLGYNNISFVPDALAQLSLLKELSLRSNPVYSLPHRFGSEMTYLTYLDIFGTCIKHLPQGMENLERMELLHCDPEVHANSEYKFRIVNY